MTISSLKQRSMMPKPTYKKFLGYSPGVAVINDMIVGIENRDGNTNVRFNQRETLERIFKATGGIRSIYIPCPHGLRLMLGGKS